MVGLEVVVFDVLKGLLVGCAFGFDCAWFTLRCNSVVRVSFVCCFVLFYVYSYILRL